MPTIPPEGTYTETELHFIEAQPPGLWPENQDSIFGQFRKVICDILQGRRDEIEMLATERFVPSSTNYLSLWEEMLGVTIAQSGKTVGQRRAVLETRLKWGAFSRAQRNAIIESFILPTMTGGLPAAFTPSGIPFGAGGIPLYGPGGLVSQKYRVYEDPVNFAYTVWIDSANVPDVPALTRELSRVTPAGIAFTIDTTHTGTALIDWLRTMKAVGSNGWWKLGADYNDYSGYANNGTVTGAPAALASPGLLLCPLGEGSNAARVFTGTELVSITDTTQLSTTPFSMRALARVDTSVPSSAVYRRIYSAGNNGVPNCFIGIVGDITAHAQFVLRVYNGTTYVEARGTTNVVLGTTYSVTGTYDGQTAKLYVNGVLEGAATLTGPAVMVGTKRIAASPSGSEPWIGAIDEVMICGYPLSASQVLYLSNQAKNIL